MTFDNKQFERNQLIEAQGYLLYLAIQQLSHLDFGLVEKKLLGLEGQIEASKPSNINSNNHSPEADKTLRANSNNDMEANKNFST